MPYANPSIPPSQVTESHQSSKADTSGTAKALVNSLGTLAGDVRDPEEVITMIRDRERQVSARMCMRRVGFPFVCLFGWWMGGVGGLG